MLTNALSGRHGLVRVECRELRLEDGDQILVCTDGLTDLVPDATIREVLRRAMPAADTCRALVELALEAGGEDNVTVALGCYHIADERG